MRYFKRRRGTAEVIGTAFFLVILFVVLANILWYNQATLEMNKQLSQKANSQVGLETTDGLMLRVKSLGSYDVEIKGLWIVDEDQNIHYYIKRDDYIAAGSLIEFPITYSPPSPPDVITFKIITDLGNMAITSYDYTPLP